MSLASSSLGWKKKKNLISSFVVLKDKTFDIGYLPNSSLTFGVLKDKTSKFLKRWSFEVLKDKNRKALHSTTTLNSSKITKSMSEMNIAIETTLFGTAWRIIVYIFSASSNFLSSCTLEAN